MADLGQSVDQALKFPMILGQGFGMLPVAGIGDGSLQFRWRSARVIYTLLVMGLLIFAIIMVYYQSREGGFNFAHLVTTVYYATGLITLGLHLHLATNFAALMGNWREADKIMNQHYGYPKRLNLALTITTISSSISIIVHLLFGIMFHFAKRPAEYDKIYFMEKFFFKYSFPEVCYAKSTSLITRALTSLASWYCTCIFTHNDAFIILVSITLALRFRQVTVSIARNQRKVNCDEFWVTIRRNYDQLSKLCKSLDSSISFIVLLSFAGNIFFTLTQFFYSLRTITETLDRAYFFYSFLHLLVKLVCVSLYAAWINDESKEPANILYSLSSTTYNTEIRRLLLQISFDNVALTGSKMFKITRGLILSVASAIVTYELVLIQFNSTAKPPTKRRLIKSINENVKHANGFFTARALLDVEERSMVSLDNYIEITQVRSFSDIM